MLTWLEILIYDDAVTGKIRPTVLNINSTFFLNNNIFLIKL